MLPKAKQFKYRLSCTLAARDLVRVSRMQVTVAAIAARSCRLRRYLITVARMVNLVRLSGRNQTMSYGARAS